MLPGTRIVGFGLLVGSFGVTFLSSWKGWPKERTAVALYSMLMLGSLVSGVGLVGAALREEWTCWRGACVRRTEDPILFWLLVLTMAWLFLFLTAFSAHRLWSLAVPRPA